MSNDRDHPTYLYISLSLSEKSALIQADRLSRLLVCCPSLSKMDWTLTIRASFSLLFVTGILSCGGTS